MLTPTRTSKRAAVGARHALEGLDEAQPARTARSGSSSCTAGTPKTPTTASPMNFSTVPPWDSITLRARVVVAPQQGVDVLGVGGLAHGREGDEVAEEGGDDLALLGLGRADK